MLNNAHRVGSITAGVSMIGFGVLFLLHLVFNILTYSFILSLWPIILIILGVEILVSNFMKKTFIYDVGAVFLTVIMALLACVMAGADIILSSRIFL